MSKQAVLNQQGWNILRVIRSLRHLNTYEMESLLFLLRLQNGIENLSRNSCPLPIFTYSCVLMSTKTVVSTSIWLRCFIVFIFFYTLCPISLYCMLRHVCFLLLKPLSMFHTIFSATVSTFMVQSLYFTFCSTYIEDGIKCIQLRKQKFQY